MIRHVLLYKFRPSATEQERRKAVTMLNALGSYIPEVREWSIGEHALSSSKAYDLAQISSFDDVEALERYRRHPEHIKVRDFLSEIADWVLVDYEFEVK